MNFPQKMRRWFYAVLAMLALAEIAAPHIFEGESHFAFENLPAWGSAYGLASCVVIIVVSKFIGSLGLTRSENYYDQKSSKNHD